MYTIVALGNPGKKYENTRHNVGFMVADKIQLKTQNSKLKIIKPDTFMNRSGEAVAQFKDRVGELVVIHDDIDLPLGTLRVRMGGASGGHKGVQSIIDTLGSDDFVRVRIGVSRPPQGVEAEEYVLKSFTKSEIEELEKVIDAAAQLVLDSLGTGKFEEKTITI
ncbi:MAG: aminoacyl-tRNA hydrolase [Patescibacteria group bacterium]